MAGGDATLHVPVGRAEMGLRGRAWNSPLTDLNWLAGFAKAGHWGLLVVRAGHPSVRLAK